MNYLLSKYATAIAALAGIISIPLIIYEVSQSLSAAITSAIIISAFLGLPAAAYIFRPHFQKRQGVEKYSRRFLIAKKFERIKIDRRYRAEISTEKHFIFTDEPHAIDFVDTIEVLSGDEINERVYSSSNSSIAKVVRARDSTVAIYWTPTKSVELYAPHIHNYRYISPDGSEYGPHWFWQGYHCDANTGFCDWKFECPEKVIEAFAFILPTFPSTNITNRKMYRAYRSGLRNTSQPEISTDGHHLTWHIKRPELNKTQILVAIYEDGIRDFEESTRWKLLN